MTAELEADKVYTWTDENGKLHITQEPPPKKAELKDTMDYQPQPAKADLENERRKEIGTEAELKKQKSDEEYKKHKLKVLNLQFLLFQLIFQLLWQDKSVL